MTNIKTCKSCKKTIGKKIKLQCGQCKGYFHLECGNISEVDARVMQAEKTPWTCVVCLQELRQPPAVSQSGNRRISDLFSLPTNQSACGLDVEIKFLIRELQDEIREMRKTMEFFNEKYEEESKRNKVLSDMVSEISKDNQDLRKEVQKLKQSLNYQEINKLKTNICISGLLGANEEVSSSKDKIVKLIQGLNVQIVQEDIQNIKLIKIRNEMKAVVTLKSLDMKQEILSARAKKGKITKQNMGVGETTQAIYLDEELSKDAYNLFKKAKEQLKQKNYKYVWHRNGKILARKMDGDRYIVIREEEDLESLL